MPEDLHMRRSRKNRSKRALARFATALLVLIVVASAAGFAVLGMREFPPPTQTVEKPIPNERFPR